MVQLPLSSALHFPKLLRESSNGEPEDFGGLYRQFCIAHVLSCSHCRWRWRKIEHSALMTIGTAATAHRLEDHAVILQAIKLLKQQDSLLGARINCQAQIPVVAGPPEGQGNSAKSCSLVQDVDGLAGVLPLHWRGRDPPAAVRDALRRCAGRPPAWPRCPWARWQRQPSRRQPHLHGQPDPLPRWSQSEHVLLLSCP